MSSSYYRVGDQRFIEASGQTTIVPASDCPPAKPAPVKQRTRRTKRRTPVPRVKDAPGQRLFPGFIEFSQPREGDCDE
jgi:hypothetical protein